MNRLVLVVVAACSDTGDPRPDAGPDAPPPTPAKLAMSMAPITVPPIYLQGIPRATAIVTNTGETNTGTITVASSGSGDFSVQSTCTTLAPAGTCVIAIAFTPSLPGEAPMGFVEAFADPGGAVAEIIIGMSAPSSLAVMPTMYAFPAQQIGTTSAAPLVATIRNTTTVATGMLKVSLDPPWALGTNGCTGQVLGPAATCTISIDYKPTVVTPGGEHGALVILDAGHGVAKVTLAGQSAP